MKQYQRYFLPIGTFILVLGIWEILVRILKISSYVLPTPSKIVTAIVSDFENLWLHSMVTLGEALLGLVIAAVLAVLIAVLMDLSKTMYHSVFPYLVVTQTVPVLVLGPLFTIWFGFGMMPKVLIVVLMCFFPIIISLSDALQNVDKHQMNLLRSFGANKIQQYLYVKLPAAATALISGLKVSATYCIGGAIVGEWLSASAGLGYYMIRLKNGFAMDKVFACVIAIIFWSLILNLVITVIERRIFPYKKGKKYG